MVDLVRRPQNAIHHGLRAGLEDYPLRQIAQELAQRIEPKETILRKYDISPGEWDVIRKTQYFRELLREATEEWNSPASADDRIRLKSKKALEDSIVTLYEIAHNERNPPKARIDAVERMSRMSGIERQAETPKGGGAGGFSININIGDAGSQTITVSPEHRLEDGEGDYAVEE